MIYIHVKTPPAFPEKVLVEAARATLSLAPDPSGDLTLVFTTDNELRKLNREFLSMDQPTDVLAFPSDEEDPDTGRRYLGDVIISMETASRQARLGGHELGAELQLLIVHGVLHLLGYDHASPEEKEQMWTVQAEVLAKLGHNHSLMDRGNGQ